jgi:hypothetical protein
VSLEERDALIVTRDEAVLAVVEVPVEVEDFETEFDLRPSPLVDRNEIVERHDAPPAKLAQLAAGLAGWHDGRASRRWSISVFRAAALRCGPMSEPCRSKRSMRTESVSTGPGVSGAAIERNP